MIKRALVALILGAFATAAVYASETDKVKERVVETLERLNPSLSVSEVSSTPVPGLFEVVVGGQIVYFSADGRYMVQGELVDIREQRSLTEASRTLQRQAHLSRIDPAELITYPAQGETKHRVIVVTDIDCPYCRRMHAYMDDINALGIEVSYLQMPRAGVGSESYRKAVSVYCADNPQEAMDRAKAGGSVANNNCENPVRSHMELTAQLGINATPTTVTEDGAVIPGYMEAEALLRRLEQR
ncbi:hypothetical protein CAI21_16890 [Alkalilimnicola ehrlichii]|uniref:Thiol:disulfide interchange protein n=1 Tax=Alkalilimnicola ehrlichii TaxID=351052 RepID=A0A3E0WMQ8_9GAMM|nr:DsbC family protein [Alkalilimnicola ehrlichii]RFA26367.1 hypothetical protein CAI21_16890 [Alkalilimnicola ehrlichii]RFA33431.1 hypothetical protein CAL65_17375 [Alkalilimnicola ehrlichii]